MHGSGNKKTLLEIVDELLNGNEKRLLIEVNLKPVQGDRFQPTLFPNLGPAVYFTPDGRKKLLVESVQSMANRLEMICWDEKTGSLVEPLKGLPYVEVSVKKSVKVKEEKTKKEVQWIEVTTNSLLEAHRLNSNYIIEGKVLSGDFNIKKVEEFSSQFLDKKKDFIKFLFKYDPNSLLHGAFFSGIGNGRCRLSRALSAFIEAEDINEVVSGGVKFDVVDPSGIKPSSDERATADIQENVGEDSDSSQRVKSKSITGNIPYSRIEFTGKLKAFFNLDLDQIRNYHLGRTAEQFLVVLALFKIARFLNHGLRLRTACDLTVESVKVRSSPSGTHSFEELENSLQLEKNASTVLPQLIEKCRRKEGCEEAFIENPPVKLEFKEKNKKKEGAEESEEEGEE